VRAPPARHHCRFHCPAPSRKDVAGGWAGIRHRIQEGLGQDRLRPVLLSCTAVAVAVAVASASATAPAPAYPTTRHTLLPSPTTFTSCRVASVAVSGSRGAPGPRPAPRMARAEGEGEGKSAASKPAGKTASVLYMSTLPGVECHQASIHHPSAEPVKIRVLTLCNRCSHRRLGVPYFIGLSVSRPSHGKVMR
jgi:hypothetical protein